MNLDSPGDIADLDASGALADVESAPQQWRQAASAADVRLDLGGVDAIVVTGMGGSGIVADVAGALAADRLPVPLVAHKGYGLPAFAGPRTLVVAVSYSGTTEETRSAVAAARERGCRLFAVSSGGDLGATCDEAGVPWVRVPPGPQPRHALGSLAVPVLVALGLDDGLDEAIGELERAVGACARDAPTARNPAKQLGERLADGGLPVLWGGRGIPAVAAYRLKCQLNENAELPALAAEVPEVDHNEVVAWAREAPGAAGLVTFADPIGDHPRVARRLAVTASLVADRFAWHEELIASGSAPVARLASLVAVGDLASVYAALALGRDPTPIAAIDRLKADLGREPAQ